MLHRAAAACTIFAAAALGCGSVKTHDDIAQACAPATDILENGEPTGFVRCADGSIDRVTDVWTSCADCSADEACVPLTLLQEVGWVDRACAPATCRSSADCASGECGLDMWEAGGCPVVAELACRTTEDACRTDAACGDRDWQCLAPPAYLAEPRSWTCNTRFCDAAPDTDSIR